MDFVVVLADLSSDPGEIGPLLQVEVVHGEGEAEGGGIDGSDCWAF